MQRAHSEGDQTHLLLLLLAQALRSSDEPLKGCNAIKATGGTHAGKATVHCHQTLFLHNAACVKLRQSLYDGPSTCLQRVPAGVCGASW